MIDIGEKIMSQEKFSPPQVSDARFIWKLVKYGLPTAAVLAIAYSLYQIYTLGSENENLKKDLAEEKKKLESKQKELEKFQQEKTSTESIESLQTVLLLQEKKKLIETNSTLSDELNKIKNEKKISDGKIANFENEISLKNSTTIKLEELQQKLSLEIKSHLQTIENLKKENLQLKEDNKSIEKIKDRWKSTSETQSKLLEQNPPEKITLLENEFKQKEETWSSEKESLNVEINLLKENLKNKENLEKELSKLQESSEETQKLHEETQAKLKQEIEAKQLEISGLSEKNSGLQINLDEEKKASKETQEKLQQELKEKETSLGLEIEGLKIQVTSITKTVQRNESIINEQKSQIETLESDKENLNEELLKLQKSLEETKKLARETEEDLNKQIETKQRGMNTLSEKASELETKLEKEKKVSQETQEKLQQEIDTQKQSVEKLSETALQNAKTIQEKEIQVQLQLEKIVSQKEKLEALEKEKVELGNKIAELSEKTTINQITTNKENIKKEKIISITHPTPQSTYITPQSTYKSHNPNTLYQASSRKLVNSTIKQPATLQLSDKKLKIVIKLVDLYNQTDRSDPEKLLAKLLIFQLMLHKNDKTIKQIIDNVKLMLDGKLNSEGNQLFLAILDKYKDIEDKITGAALNESELANFQKELENGKTVPNDTTAASVFAVLFNKITTPTQRTDENITEEYYLKRFLSKISAGTLSSSYSQNNLNSSI